MRGSSQESHEEKSSEEGAKDAGNRPDGAKLHVKGSQEYLMEGLEDDGNEADVSAMCDLGMSSGLVLLVDVARDTLDRLKEGLESNGGVHTVSPPSPQRSAAQRSTAQHSALVAPLER